MEDANEEKLLRAVTLQNTRAVLQARERAEKELLKTKEELEQSNRQIEELLARERELREEAEMLSEVARTLSGELDLQRLIQSVTDAATKLTAAQFGAFFYNVTDEREESYPLYSLSGAPREAFEKFGTPRNTPLFETTFRGEGVVRVADVLQDSRYGKSPPHYGMPKGHLPVRSYLAVPVISRSGEVLGGLFFGHPEPGVFTERAERITTGIAAHAAIAIDNARLFAISENEIAQRKQAEERYRSLVGVITDVAWTTDAQGAFVTFQPQWSAYTGQTWQELRGFGWANALHPEDRALVRAVWEKACEARTLYESHGRLWHAPSKQYRYFIGRATPVLNTDGSVREWVGSCTDVDEQKQAEEERERLLIREQQARREAEEASRLKDEFLALVSHELRTPLNAVLGWAHMLRVGQLGGERAMLAVETIERNARAQNQLIDDLLDVSRIITGKLRLEVRPIDPSICIAGAIESLRPAAEAKGVHVQSVLDTTVGAIAGDANRLQQVVWNLLSNAIKFTPRGGRVHVRLERVDSHIEIVVSDSGAGIKPEFLPFVFDRFRQADSATTRTHGGLGLGLAIVRHLVELQGGEVRADSSGEGTGATFTVKLPLIAVYQRQGEEPVGPFTTDAVLRVEPAERLDGVTVLVVDDEPDTCELLKTMLAKCGAEVVTVNSAKAALDAIERSEFDLIVSDIGMPGRDGYELMQTIRSLPAQRGGRIPAIALTAYARTEDRLRALRAGYEMHVPKPIEYAELVTVMASLTSRERGRRLVPTPKSGNGQYDDE